jgi:hypothetical protein
MASMRSYERLRVKKQDRGRHCRFRHGVFLAARIPFFDGGQFDEGRSLHSMEVVRIIGASRRMLI